MIPLTTTEPEPVLLTGVDFSVTDSGNRRASMVLKLEPADADFGLIGFNFEPYTAGNFCCFNEFNGTRYGKFSCADDYTGGVTITVEVDGHEASGVFTCQ